MRVSLEERQKTEDVDGLEEIKAIRDDLIFIRNGAVEDDVGDLSDAIILLSHAIQPLSILIKKAEAKLVETSNENLE